MVMCDYFSAADDDTAVGVVDGGPDADEFDVLYLKGFDPVVMMGTLEAILTGCTYDEARERPRSGQLLSSPEGEAFVVSVSDTLQTALVAASTADLAVAAARWSDTDELRADEITPQVAGEALALLAGLAARARSAGLRVFCWWAL